MSIVKAENARTVAAVDLGSNSIKMTIGRPGSDGAVEEVLARSETVRLGQGIEQNGELARDRIDAALETLRRFVEEARSSGAARIIGVATEATRVASNGPAFLDRVRALGIEIQAISGDREAQLTFLGLKGIVDLRGDVVIADIGGASTEIILAKHEAVTWSRSFAVGSGRLTDRHVVADPPATAEIEACRADATAILAAAPFSPGVEQRLLVVGGTGEYLDRLVPEGVERTPAALDAVLARLAAMPAAELAALLTIAEARARVLPAGVAIARAVADLVRPSSFVAAQSGIRLGLLQAAFAGEL